MTVPPSDPAIRPVQPGDDVDHVARLAREIWTEYYPPIIGLPQVEYMLDRFQSGAAIARQMEAGVRYYLIESDHVPIGYFAAEVRSDLLFLSKIYVLVRERGRGHGARSLAYLRRLAASCRCRAIELTVNKHNDGAIRAYERLGFRRSGERLTDIGGGFVMDDYVYQLDVGAE